jgi:predicted transcriptional regulator
LPPATSPEIYKDKQQRLAEISMRLEAIQKEQKQLLQEATELLATDIN